MRGLAVVSRTPRWCRSATTCSPMSTRGWARGRSGARSRRRGTAERAEAAAPVSPRAAVTASATSRALRCACSRALSACAACAPPPPPAPRAPPRAPGARHHRHAPRRSARRLRQHDRRHAEPGSPRAARARWPCTRRRTCRSRGRRTSRSSPVCIRPSTAFATTCRRRSARTCRCSPRSCSSAASAPRAFVSSIVLSKQSGLGRGFDTYSDQFDIGEDDARFLNTIQKRGDATVAEAAAWLRAPGPERRFAWVHLYDPHDPYEPPEPYASRYAGSALRRRGGVVRRAGRPARRGARRRGAARRHAVRRHVRPRRRARRARRGGARVLRLRNHARTCRCIVRGPGITPGTRLERRDAHRST